ncbi:HlyD family secretion protein [Sphingomonas laterariae]|uniref:HlyD family secretion protein n=2 Tax=Edaphosphingomonas laterariae TaxID=861865 RepID=A0A239BKS2_9SPHN|nr:HlyD family secretion protein [Sphingomonas laterariae]
MDQPAVTTRSDLDEFLGVEPPSRYGRYLKWGAVGLGVLLALWIAWRMIAGSGGEVSYATQSVKRGDLTVTVSATGNLQPTNQVDVGSELSGTVTEVFVDNNDRVTKGQVLARLDTSRLQDAINQSKAQLASAQASVMQAQATAQQSRANLNRLQEVYRLSGGKVPSATELDTARAENARAVAGIRTAEAQVAQARAQLSSDQTQYSKALIVSPVNGVVLSRQIEPGQTVAASLNAPVLFQIAEDLRRMRLEVKVDEADVGQVKQGQRATFQVDAFPGRTFPALIERVDLGANASSTSSSSSSSSTSSASSVVAYVARLTVANEDELLRPGMTATADIVTTEKRDVLLVPNAALRFSPDRAAAGSGQRGGLTSVLAPSPPRRGNRGGASREVSIGRGSQQTVYVVGEDGKPKPIRVTVGDTNGSETEITGADVKDGMEVITGQLAAGQTNEKRGEQRKERGEGRPDSGPDGGNVAQPAAPSASGEAAAKPAADKAMAAAAPQAAPDGDRAARRGEREAMSPEERAERRAKWDAMSPEEREQRRAERRAAREAAGGADGE